MQIKKEAYDNWSLIRKKLILRHPELTITDLIYNEGEEKDLLNRIQLKTGISKEVLISEINTLVIEA